MTEVMYLVVRSDGNVRITKRMPSLNKTEVAYRLRIHWPADWGKVLGEIELNLPGAGDLEGSLRALSDKLG